MAPDPRRAFIWRNNSGVEVGGERSYNCDVSSDGSIALGVIDAPQISYAFRSPGGRLIETNGLVESVAVAISSDGTIVAGNRFGTAFRWDTTNGLAGLSLSVARDISGDGKMILGQKAGIATYWTAETGLVSIGDLEGGTTNSIGLAANYAGSIIVGSGTSGAGTEAIIWDPTNGIRTVRSVLEGQGIDLSGWILTEATGVSSNGTVIVGNGTNSNGKAEAWIAVLSGDVPWTGAPATPTNVQAHADSRYQISLSWEQSENADGYKLQRQNGLSGAWETIALLNSNITNFTDTGLTSSQYSYRINATNSLDYSLYSEPVVVSTTKISQGDLLWQGNDGRIAWWFFQGSNFVSSALCNKTAPVGWRIAAIADFNKDGKDDLLWQSPDGALAAWTMNGTNFLGSLRLRKDVKMPVGWRIAGAGDLNLDGSSDVIWQNQNGKIAAWLFDGTNYLGAAYINGGTPAALGWQTKVVNDFNDDQRADLIFQHDDGRLAVWLLNQTNVISTALVRGGIRAPNGWKAVTSQDYNGDTQNDIVFANPSGQLAVWYMSGPTNVISSGLLRNGTAAGTNWRLVGAYQSAQ